MYIFVFFPPFACHCYGFHSHLRRSQSGLKEVTDGWAKRVFFLLSRVSLWMWRAERYWQRAVTLAAASPASLNSLAKPQPLSLSSSSPEIVSFSAACLTSTSVWALLLLFCWLDLLATLNGVWAPRPVATCQWFSSHIYRSAPAASDRTPPPHHHPHSSLSFASSWLLLFPSLAYGARRLCCCLYSPATHHPTVHFSADDNGQMAGWCAKKACIFIGLCCWITCETEAWIIRKLWHRL